MIFEKISHFYTFCQLPVCYLLVTAENSRIFVVYHKVLEHKETPENTVFSG